MSACPIGGTYKLSLFDTSVCMVCAPDSIENIYEFHSNEMFDAAQLLLPFQNALFTLYFDVHNTKI